MKTLYKYVSDAEAVKKLLEGRVRFSKVSQLNDPCEMYDEADREKVVASLHEMRRDGFSALEFDWLKRQHTLLSALVRRHPQAFPKTAKEAHARIMSSDYDRTDDLMDYQRGVVSHIRRAVGVLSLTTRYDCFPMWAHYAKNAAGYVVIFEDLANADWGKDARSKPGFALNELRPVEYAAEFRGMTVVPSSMKNLLYWKYADWGYEDEWRIFSDLEECDRIEIESESGSDEIHVRSIDQRHVSGVIFGWKVKPDNRMKILQHIQASGRSVKVYDARVSQAKVALHEVRQPT